MPNRVRFRWLLLLAAIAGAWALLGVFFASQNYLAGAYRRPRMSWRDAATYPAVTCAIWALLTPGILWLAQRFPFESGLRLRAALVHAPAAVLFSVAHVAATVAILVRVYAGRPNPMPAGRMFGIFLLGNAHTNVLTYAVLVGASHVYLYYARYRERELRASQLEAQLAQSQLQVLKMQLHPHFLFNTLHSISALMHEDVEAADRMMARLSDLLRMTLERAGSQEVPLREELDFLNLYLEIQQTRFGERLAVDRDIAAEALDARVPNLILQPLVENAIRHGISSRASGGRIAIRAVREGSVVRLEVEDDGPGMDPAHLAVNSQGLGLANTRARLEQLYGKAQRLDLENASSGGLRVRLVIPFRPAGESGMGKDEIS